jgi:hypothetical protein
MSAAESVDTCYGPGMPDRPLKPWQRLVIGCDLSAREDQSAMVVAVYDALTGRLTVVEAEFAPPMARTAWLPSPD